MSDCAEEYKLLTLTDYEKGKKKPKNLSGVCLTCLIQQMKQDLCKGSCMHLCISSSEVRWQCLCHTQLHPAPQPPGSQAVPHPSAAPAERRCRRLGLSCPRHGAGQLCSSPGGWAFLRAGSHLLFCSSLRSPGGRVGLCSSCVSVLAQTLSPLCPHPPGPCHRAPELPKHSLIH